MEFLRRDEVAIRLLDLFQKHPEIDGFAFGLAPLSHRKQIAQELIQSGYLIENEVQRGRTSALVAGSEGIFGFQPHGRDRIPDFVGDSRRQTADGRQTCRRSDAPLRLLEPLSASVQRFEEAVELWLAGKGERGTQAAGRTGESKFDFPDPT